jgi:hypothetical protein
MTHDGESNFAVTLLNDRGEMVDLLANEIGSFDGSQATGIQRDGDYLLNIQADGAWTVMVSQ